MFRIRDPLERLVAVLFFFTSSMAASEIKTRLLELGVLFSLRTFWWPVVICLATVSVVGFIFTWTSYFQEGIAWLSKSHQIPWTKNKAILWGIFLLLALGFSTWSVFKGHIVLNGIWVRLLIYGVISMVGSIFLRPLTSKGSWQVAFASSLLLTAAICRAMTYIPAVSASPFSMGWSEASRYYYGSLYFSERLYGQDLPLSPLHPSRYLLLAFPFIFPGLPIWAHRLWQVFLWIITGWGAAVLLSRRLKINHTMAFLSFSAWFFLFLHLGPVYYHLLLCVILVFWGVDFTKPTKTLVTVVLASVWAGLSRINWIPVPLFLVVTLYFLECPWSMAKDKWKYLIQPATWGIGLFCAYFAYQGYILLSGNEVNRFSSSFTSDLLWNRLWPNSTFQLGILPGTLLVSLPLWILLYVRLKNQWAHWHPIKWLGFAGMLLALLLGGLVVSVKIGGGSNLHNMDAYFLLLGTITSYIFWKREVYDQEVPVPKRQTDGIPWIVALGICVPVWMTIQSVHVIGLPDLQRDREDLHQLTHIVSELDAAGGEILFISERQLQVFDLVPDIPFVAEYEKLLLMEMAMARNEPYLQRFSEDVSSQRFALIISDTTQTSMQDEAKAFSEENNIWVAEVMRTLVKHYEPTRLGTRTNIILFVPRQK